MLLEPFFGLCLISPVLIANDELRPNPAKLAESRRRAVEFLKTSQREDGGWTAPNATGISALVAHALLRTGVSPDDPVLVKALVHIAGELQGDGRIAAADSRVPGYETAIALMTLQAANSSGRYTDAIEAGEKFVRSLQFGEQTGTQPEDLQYGGSGYGPGGSRPDLSNTVFFLEALQATGAKPDDPAVQEALVFLSRCQNLESEFNPGAKTVNDGGFFDSPAAGGTSPAGSSAEGGLRSYGSTTYAGLKSTA